MRGCSAPAGLLVGMPGSNQAHLSARDGACVASQRCGVIFVLAQRSPQVIAQTAAACHERGFKACARAFVGFECLNDLLRFRHRLFDIACTVILVILRFRGIQPALRFGQRVVVLGNARFVELAKALLQGVKCLAIRKDLFFRDALLLRGQACGLRFGPWRFVFDSILRTSHKG